MSFPFAVMGAVAAAKQVRIDGGWKQALLTAVCLSAATLLLIGILYSLSRMGFVACLFSVLVMGLSLLLAGSSHALRRKALLGLAFLILLAFVFLPSDPLIARFADLSSAEEVSEQNRLQVWKETLGLIRDFPWAGSGLGTYESVFLRHKQIGELMRDNYAHNDYLQGLAELGLLGFSLVAAFLSLSLVQDCFRDLGRFHAQCAIPGGCLSWLDGRNTAPQRCGLQPLCGAERDVAQLGERDWGIDFAWASGLSFRVPLQK